MIDFSQAILDKVAIHYIGNPKQSGELICSKHLLKLSDPVRPLLQTYFQHPFRNAGIWFQFLNSTAKVKNACGEIFAKKEKFLFHSVQIAKHLFESTNHASIKEGELLVAYFSEVTIEGFQTDVVGIFKSENKETYLKIMQQQDEFSMDHDEGINIHKLDKGCLVFNLEQEEGYRICITDATSANEEARYWKNDFLELKPRNDNYHKTQSLMNLCKDFCKEVLVEDNSVSPVDRMVVMNDSVKYMQQNSSFTLDEFEKDVFQEPAVIEAFHDYKRNYQPIREMQVDLDSIEVEPTAFKNNKKFFKQVMKLDKNFHVYVHGNPELIERGFDEQRQMKFYKFYYISETHPD